MIKNNKLQCFILGGISFPPVLFWQGRAAVGWFTSSDFTTSDSEQTALTHRHTRTHAGGSSPGGSSSCSPASWALLGLALGSSPDKRWTYLRSYHGNIPSVRSAPWMCTALMETMSPQQGTMGQNRSDSLTGESKAPTENKKVTAARLCWWSGGHSASCAYLRTETPDTLLDSNLTLTRRETLFWR